MSDPTRCPVTGYLVVDGRRIRALRCQLDAGHERERSIYDDGNGGETRDYYDSAIGTTRLRTEPGTLHAVTFHWADDVELAADWPEAYDPDEPIDVDVPELSDEQREAAERELDVDRAIDAHREARAFGDD